MLNFDFITGDDFRASLEADYRELVVCMEASAWKSVLVLAGSIVETLLIDYLVASDYQKRANKDPLKIELADAIAICKQEGVLKPRTADLCSAVRSYRNLIHPGRAVRLNDQVDADGAKIAASLVGVIAREIATLRQQTYGLTADQIVSKLERDASSAAIVSHLLAEMNPIERERLLLRVLPAKYFDAAPRIPEDEYDESRKNAFLKRLTDCFRLTFDAAPSELKQRVVSRYAKVIREDNEYQVLTYGLAFFRSVDLAFVEAPQRDVIREHILGRFKDGVTENHLRLAAGIEKYLDLKAVLSWIDPIIRKVASTATPDAERAMLRQYLVRGYVNMPQDIADRVLRRLKEWKTIYANRGQTESVIAIASVEDALLPSDDDLPF